jgi:hypothetical protein
VGSAETLSTPTDFNFGKMLRKCALTVFSKTLSEASVSITRTGTLHGHEMVLVTLRGPTSPASRRRSSRHLSDSKRTARGSPTGRQPSHYCTVHEIALQHQQKDGRTWLSHWVEAEQRWCTGK